MHKELIPNMSTQYKNSRVNKIYTERKKNVMNATNYINKHTATLHLKSSFSYVLMHTHTQTNIYI